jgi:hypothetical protein
MGLLSSDQPNLQINLHCTPIREVAKLSLHDGTRLGGTECRSAAFGAQVDPVLRNPLERM